MGQMTVEQWKELFQGVGLSEADMVKWHRLFEAKYPKAHQNFLEWLGVEAPQIRAIRKN